MSDINWHYIFELRCKSKRGGGLTPEEQQAIQEAYAADPGKYKEMNDDVFDATVPAGSTVTAAILKKRKNNS